MQRIFGWEDDFMLDITFHEADRRPIDGHTSNRFPIYDLGNHKFGYSLKNQQTPKSLAG